MAVEKVEMFTVVCDNCKLNIGIDQEYSCWNDPDYAEENAMESDWIKHEGKHFCNDCYDYDDNDEIVINESKRDKYLNE